MNDNDKPTPSQIFRSLEEVARSHERLASKFKEFCTSADVLASGSSHIQGVVLDPHLDDNYFIVTFCGHVFQFVFSIGLDAKGASIGMITCVRQSTPAVSGAEFVDSFSFSKSGEAKVPRPPEFEDPIHVDSDHGAAYLVCRCMYRGMLSVAN